MNNDTLYEQLLDVISDILHCKDELSSHNKKGHYAIKADDNNKLVIDFKWVKEKKKW